MAKLRKHSSTHHQPQLQRMAQLLARQAAGELLRPEGPTKDFQRVRYLKPAEVARLVGKSVRTVRRWIRAKILPSVKIGGARMIAIADLEQLLSPATNETNQQTDEAFSERGNSKNY